MDVAIVHDRKRMPAVPVRQFAASRVEKQLLCQVFELLLCNPPTRVEFPESMGREATATQSAPHISNDRSQCEKPLVRRRAV